VSLCATDFLVFSGCQPPPAVCTTPARLPLTLVPKTIYYIQASKRDGHTVAISVCVCVCVCVCLSVSAYEAQTGNRRNSAFQRNPRTGLGVRLRQKVQIKPHSREKFVRLKRKTSIITKHYTPPSEFGFFFCF